MILPAAGHLLRIVGAIAAGLATLEPVEIHFYRSGDRPAGA